MRTTLDIDQDVLQAAKEIAQRERSTAGAVLSRLARTGLTGGDASEVAEASSWKSLIEYDEDGIPGIAARPGVVITSELVARLDEESY